FCYCYGVQRDLHSFPTRRSSDLRIWHHPVINRWLTGHYKIWNEASIILKNGETIRPDKVFTNDDETIVLDFKFTKGDYADHQWRSEEHTSELQSRENLVCRLLLE